MSKDIQRAYPRIAFEAPIQLCAVNRENPFPFHDAQTINYSSGGFCYVAEQLPTADTEVCVIMKNYAPEHSGPESYKSYLTRVCWVHSVAAKQHQSIAGARIIARSHEVLGTCDSARQLCDMCQALMSTCQLFSIDGKTQLCEYCCNYIHSLPPGKIRESLERYLLGNVV